MGLTLSEEKTNVTHITEGFDFLGYRIIRGVWGEVANMVPKVLIPDRRHEANSAHKIRANARPKHTQ